MASKNAEKVAKKKLEKDIKEKLVDIGDVLQESYERRKRLNLSSIYIIKCGVYYKIGYAYDVASRFCSIKLSNPYEIYLVFSFKVTDAKKFEKELHKIFESKKHRGEWFILDDEDIREIKELSVIEGFKIK
jgi:hypothetical protein